MPYENEYDMVETVDELRLSNPWADNPFSLLRASDALKAMVRPSAAQMVPPPIAAASSSAAAPAAVAGSSSLPNCRLPLSSEYS